MVRISIFSSSFTEGKDGVAKINGLIWMGGKKVCMLRQIQEKLEQNFTCIKLKIGRLGNRKKSFQNLRKEFSENYIRNSGRC